MLARLLVASSFFLPCVPGQTPVEAAHQFRIKHQAEILQGFTTLLSIPNVAAEPVSLQRNAETLVSLLKDRQFDAKLLSIPGAPPVVFGERKTPGAQHTIVFYAHYDGQPVTPSEWQSPPFTPTIR